MPILAIFVLTATQQVQLFTMALGAVIFLLTLEMIRRDLLRTAYALLWLASGLAIVAIGIFPGTIDKLTRITGMNYQTALLFCVFGFLLILMMQYSILMSRLSNRNKHLAQDLAILREQVRQLKAKCDPPTAPAPDRDPAADSPDK